MTQKLVVFGDSFVQDASHDMSMSRILANKMNLELVNYGLGGSSTEYSIECLQNYIENNNSESDIILFSFSQADRSSIRMPNENHAYLVTMLKRIIKEVKNKDDVMVMMYEHMKKHISSDIIDSYNNAEEFLDRYIGFNYQYDYFTRRYDAAETTKHVGLYAFLKYTLSSQCEKIVILNPHGESCYDDNGHIPVSNHLHIDVNLHVLASRNDPYLLNHMSINKREILATQLCESIHSMTNCVMQADFIDEVGS